MATKNSTPIEGFSEWGKLTEQEQTAVKQEATEVLQNLKSEAQSKLGVGEGLVKIKKILEPKRMFIKFIDEVFHLSRATAYRYIDMYDTGKTYLSEPMLQEAIILGTPIKKEVLEKNPPPKTEDPIEMRKYLQSITVRPDRGIHQIDKAITERECFNFVRLRDERVSSVSSPADLKKWRKTLLGRFLTHWGLEASELKPVPVPDNYIPSLGRPADVRGGQKAA